MDEYYEKRKALCGRNLFCQSVGAVSKGLSLVKKGARIFDVGSGSGRDACYFPQQGYQVPALEPSRNLCLEIPKVFSGEIVCSDIQKYQLTQRFDGISTSKSADGRYFLEFTE